MLISELILFQRSRPGVLPGAQDFVQDSGKGALFTCHSLSPFSVPLALSCRSVPPICESEGKQNTWMLTRLNEKCCLDDEVCVCVCCAFYTPPLSPLAGEHWLLSELIGTQTPPTSPCSRHFSCSSPPLSLPPHTHTPWCWWYVYDTKVKLFQQWDFHRGWL